MRRTSQIAIVLVMLGCSATFGQPPAPPPPAPVPSAASAAGINNGPPPAANGGPATYNPGAFGSGPALGPPPGAAPTCTPFTDAMPCRLWFSADYLLWWTKNNHLPPLLTTGSTDDRVPGALGQPNTQVLFGGSMNLDERSGGRFELGYWFTDDHLIGWDAGFFFLSERTLAFTASSPGEPLLTVPYTNANTGNEAAFRLAFPGRRSATFDAALNNRFWGAQTNLRSAVWQDDVVQVQLLAGFRYLELNESLDTFADVTRSNGSEIQSAQHFGTRNYFYGGQLGAQTTLSLGRWTVDLTGKIAMGATHEVALLEGSTAATSAGGIQNLVPFSTLVLPTNAGRYSRDIFSVVPEGGINFGYQLTPHARCTVGYTFLYLSDAVRPGDVIDTTLNPTQLRTILGQGSLSGPLRPVFTGNASDFWAQGLNLGLEFRY